MIKAHNKDSLYEKLYDYYFGKVFCSFTVKEIFEKALEDKQLTENPKEATLRKYRFEFNRYLSKSIQTTEIQKISETDLKKYTQQLITSTTLTKKQFLSYKGLINMIFAYAHKNGIIKDNPVLHIKNAVYLKSCDCSFPEPDERILSPGEIQCLLDEASKRAQSKYYIMYYALFFSVHTGCRVGEICAMKWEDIDFINDLIHIHSQQLSLDKNGRCEYYLVNYTKNECGVTNGGRYFPLTEDLRAMLNDLKRKQEQNNISSDFIFSYPAGNWITTRGYSCFLRRLCRHYGLSITNNHAFRMSLNSNVLIPNGICVTDRAKLLGHSVATNLKYYSYAKKDYIENARNVLNSISTPSREPLENPYNTIPFRQKKSPQTASL